MTELSPERYLKKLAGRTDIDDVQKRLDKLTNEEPEARMATAQVLKSTHTVDDRVQVATVDEKVKSGDDNVTKITDGA